MGKLAVPVGQPHLATWQADDGQRIGLFPTELGDEREHWLHVLSPVGETAKDQAGMVSSRRG